MPGGDGTVTGKVGTAALVLATVLGALSGLQGPAERLMQSGWKGLGLYDQAILAVAAVAGLLFLAWLVGHWVRPLSRFMARQSLRLLLIALAVLVLYGAWHVRPVSWILAALAVVYFSARLYTMLGRWQPGVLQRVLLDDVFLAGAQLGAGWDASHPGAAQMLWTDNGLRVEWQRLAQYSQTGYLVKVLPVVDLRIEAEVEPDVYNPGWDPGIHFYPAGSMVYCLSIGLVPEGHGQQPHGSVSGLSVRTENPGTPSGYIEHGRVAVASGTTAAISVELCGSQARVEIEGHVWDLGLAMRPQELVVGAWKWMQVPGAAAPFSARHRVRRVRVVRG